MSGYPLQRTCREFRRTIHGVDVVVVDFGDCADVSPRFHMTIEEGQPLAPMSWSGDNFTEMFRVGVRELLDAVCKGPALT